VHQPQARGQYCTLFWAQYCTELLYITMSNPSQGPARGPGHPPEAPAVHQPQAGARSQYCMLCTTHYMHYVQTGTQYCTSCTDPSQGPARGPAHLPEAPAVSIRGQGHSTVHHVQTGTQYCSLHHVETRAQAGEHSRADPTSGAGRGDLKGRAGGRGAHHKVS